MESVGPREDLPLSKEPRPTTQDKNKAIEELMKRIETPEAFQKLIEECNKNLKDKDLSVVNLKEFISVNSTPKNITEGLIQGAEWTITAGDIIKFIDANINVDLPEWLIPQEGFKHLNEVVGGLKTIKTMIKIYTVGRKYLLINEVEKRIEKEKGLTETEKIKFKKWVEAEKIKLENEIPLITIKSVKRVASIAKMSIKAAIAAGRIQSAVGKELLSGLGVFGNILGIAISSYYVHEARQSERRHDEWGIEGKLGVGQATNDTVIKGMTQTTDKTRRNNYRKQYDRQIEVIENAAELLDPSSLYKSLGLNKGTKKKSIEEITKHMQRKMNDKNFDPIHEINVRLKAAGKPLITKTNDLFKPEYRHLLLGSVLKQKLGFDVALQPISKENLTEVKQFLIKESVKHLLGIDEPRKSLYVKKMMELDKGTTHVDLKAKQNVLAHLEKMQKKDQVKSSQEDNFKGKAIEIFKNHQTFEKKAESFKKELGVDLAEVDEILSSHPKFKIHGKNPRIGISNNDELRIALNTKDVRDVMIRMHANRQQALSVQSKAAIKTLAIEKKQIENRFMKLKTIMSVSFLTIGLVGLVASIVAAVLCPLAVPFIGLGFTVAGYGLLTAGKAYAYYHMPISSFEWTVIDEIKGLFRGLQLSYYSGKKEGIENKQTQRKFIATQIDLAKGNKIKTKELLDAFGLKPGQLSKLEKLFKEKNNEVSISEQSDLEYYTEKVNTLKAKIRPYQLAQSKAIWMDYHNMIRERMGKERTSLAEVHDKLINLSEPNPKPEYSELLDDFPLILHKLIKEGGMDKDLQEFLSEEMRISEKDLKGENPNTLRKGINQFLVMNSDQIGVFLKQREIEKEAEESIRKRNAA